MGRPRKPICGVGINDSDQPISKIINGKRVDCKFYQTWRDMITRCYSERFKLKYPTYATCETVHDWHMFTKFKAWMESQDYDGNHLDKDLLIEGNKVYGPDTCIFIPQALNKFLLDNKSNSGKLMKGVKIRPYGSFYAECNNPFGEGYLGTFHDEESANAAYLAKKREIAILWSNEQTDQRIAIALRKLFT